MSQNLSEGPVLISGVTVAEINQALLELQQRNDMRLGLRGRTRIYDRVGVDTASAAEDAVPLAMIQAGTAFANITFLAQAGAHLLAFQPGTTYVELGATLRQQVNFNAAHEIEARVLVSGWGTQSGANKGIAITQSDGSLIAEVLWSGNSQGLQVGAFTPVILDTDQIVQLRVKGSTATESILLRTIILDIRYAITVI